MKIQNEILFCILRIKYYFQNTISHNTDKVIYFLKLFWRQTVVSFGVVLGCLSDSSCMVAYFYRIFLISRVRIRHDDASRHYNRNVVILQLELPAK